MNIAVRCPNCRQPTDRPYRNSDWCQTCVDHTLADQHNETHQQPPQVFTA